MVLIWGQFLLCIQPNHSYSPYKNLPVVILFTDHAMLPVVIPKMCPSPNKPNIPGASLLDLEVKTWLPKGNSRQPKVIHILTHTHLVLSIAHPSPIGGSAIAPLEPGGMKSLRIDGFHTETPLRIAEKSSHRVLLRTWKMIHY